MEKPFSPGIQLLILFGLIILMGVVAQLVFSFILVSINTAGINDEILDSPWVLIGGGFCFQLIAHFGSFFLFLKFTQQSFREVIQIKPLEGKLVLLIPVLLIVCFLSVEFFGLVSNALFEAMNAHRFIDDELMYQKKIAEIFTHTNPLRLVLSLISLAVLPAIGEELIYRGILFSKLREATSNFHFAALISGIIFASVHQQPMQLIPIAFMGVFLAYVYHYTKNIWYSITLHFLINAVQISAFYFWPEVMV